MSDDKQTKSTPDRELIESVWAEARDLVKRLEGSSVQRFAVAAGDYKIEIERGAPPAPGAPAAPPPEAAAAGPVAPGAGPGMGVAPGARMASGVFTLGDMAPPDSRVPGLAPLGGSATAVGISGSSCLA